jgi:hypothetical protein
MTEHRRRIKQSESLQDRLTAFAQGIREQAESATGEERDALLDRARRADNAMEIESWANQPARHSS